MCVCRYACIHVCMYVSAGTYEDQMRVTKPLETELQLTGDCPTWVLGTGFSAIAARACPLHHYVIFS